MQEPVYARRGIFIAFEGGEGAGKSTQATLLAEVLRERGCDVLLTREPGGTDVGARLRQILLDPATGSLSARTEALIYAADKAEHVDDVILPALERGHAVITDRYVDSTLAYQGAGRALASDELERLARWATGSLRPHMTVLLDIPPDAGMSRFEGRDRIEAEPMEFHQRVRRSFLALADRDRDHYLVLDARSDVRLIHREIVTAVEPWLGQLR